VEIFERQIDHETTTSTLDLFNNFLDLKIEDGNAISDQLSKFEITYQHKPPSQYKDYVAHMVILNEPTSYKAALMSENPESWKIAISEELDALNHKNTWDIVPRPNDTNIIKRKWVFKYKYNIDASIKLHKAWLVSSQIPGTDYDDTYAPVARYGSHRMLIALSAHQR
jgi:hypothetical protein